MQAAILISLQPPRRPHISRSPTSSKITTSKRPRQDPALIITEPTQPLSTITVKISALAYMNPVYKMSLVQLTPFMNRILGALLPILVKASMRTSIMAENLDQFPLAQLLSSTTRLLPVPRLILKFMLVSSSQRNI